MFVYYCSRNNLGNNAGLAIAAILPVLESLKVLWLSDNAFSFNVEEKLRLNAFLVSGDKSTFLR